MEHYAGIDVSLELSSVCVVDERGKIVKEAKVASELRWPLLPMVLTSGHPREHERVCELPPGVAFLPKPWQPFNVLVVAEEALAYAQGNRS